MKKNFPLFCLLFFAAFTGIENRAACGMPDPATQGNSRTLTLQEAVQMTLAHSPELLMAEAQAIRSGEAVRESRSANRPQVYAGSGLAYNNGMPLSVEGAAPSVFKVEAYQSIFSKKNKNLIRESEEAGKAALLNKESTKNELAARTAIAYSRLYHARRLAALASEKLAAAEKNLKIAEALREAEKNRPVDVATANTAVSGARQQFLVAGEEANIAEAELKTYTGLPAATQLQLVEPDIANPALAAEADTLYQQALGNAPEIKQAESDIRAKEFHLEAEKGERLPELNLVGQYALLSRENNYEDYFSTFTRNNYLLGLSVKVPIFDGSRASARIARSRQELFEARFRLERTKAELKLSIQKALSALRIASGAADHAVNEVAEARENVRAGQALLESGRISDGEFEEFRSLLFQREYERVEAEQAVFQRKMELLETVGDIASVLQ
jgi:outer membrane protein